MSIDLDTQFTESVIDRVGESETGYDIGSEGWGLFCEKAEGLPVPQVGEVMRLYGRGMGYPVRGIVIAGRVYRYRTDAQEDERHRQWRADEEAKRERELTEKLAETDARIAALPLMFRERMAKFQRDGGHKFRRDYEGYELFCCEQAVEIAGVLQTEDAVLKFGKLGWDEQKLMVPKLSDGHSGNTFGAACMLARLYLANPEFVPKMHGALTPLVGCEAYGCAHESAQ